MDVNEHRNLMLPIYLLEHFSHVIDLRLRDLSRMPPLTIKIEASSGKAIISPHNSIWVEHRHYFKQEPLSQIFGKLMIGDKLFKEPFHNEGGNSFAWMHPGREHNNLLTIFSSNGEKWNVSTIKGFSKSFMSNIRSEVVD